jgi:hypothetical protein
VEENEQVKPRVRVVRNIAKKMALNRYDFKQISRWATNSTGVRFACRNHTIRTEDDPLKSVRYLEKESGPQSGFHTFA